MLRLYVPGNLDMADIGTAMAMVWAASSGISVILTNYLLAAKGATF